MKKIPRIKNGNLNTLTTKNNRGWIAGWFIEPHDPLHSDDFEVKWSKHPNPHGKEKKEPQGGPAKTITILIKGKFSVTIPETNQTFTLNKMGDYVYFDENITHTWKCLKNPSQMLTIRWPSIPSQSAKSTLKKTRKSYLAKK